MNHNTRTTTKVPKLGPAPTILSRKEIDALYETMDAIVTALRELQVEYIVTGGSLLGAIRQHSILFCDDDIDITIIDTDGAYERVSHHLSTLLGPQYQYTIKPWEGGDKVRPTRMSNVFVDIFCLRRYQTMDELRDVIGMKKNGQRQSEEYIQNIIHTIEQCAVSQSEMTPLCPFWQFSTRKAIEMWPKEVYREHELFPLTRHLKFGPLRGIVGPRMPVLLLQRAFGMDCFDVYYQSKSHTQTPKGSSSTTTAIPPHHHVVVTSPPEKEEHNHPDHGGDGGDLSLKPLVLEGGTWEGGEKVALQDEHYLPMQPIARSQRRFTLHNKEQLVKYVKDQSKQEMEWRRLPEKNARPHRTIYMDGVFDLFHIGHLEAIQQCAELGNRVIIGVTGDEDASGYKRPPIMSEDNRVAIVRALREVDDIVCPCPLIVTEEFMNERGIDLVVHGFANDADAERQSEFFEIPIQMGKFQRIQYYEGLSTTDIIGKIRAEPNSEDAPHNTTESTTPVNSHPQWFGAAIAAATDNSATIPTDPVPFTLRQVMEPHIRKATSRRDLALHAIRQATGSSTFDKVLSQFKSSGLMEGDFTFDPDTYPLRDALLRSMGLPEDTDLSRLHEHSGRKDKALYTLTTQPAIFQNSFDKFVLDVCAPHFASLFDCEEIYYQAFPCIRMVQPDEFSIGPHADVAYGHHPCSVNYYLPLTPIGGASALFLESRPGSEDWHPIMGDYGTLVKHFAGAICAHWTTENKTDQTRVSLDFRLIAGPMFHELVCGRSHSGGQRDVYREKEGYYSVCRREKHTQNGSVWRRDGSLLVPDARVGFPWTVRNWDKILQKSSEG